MKKKQFERKFAPILKDPASNPGDCPPTDRIIAHRQGELSLEERGDFLDHVVDCETCMALMERLAVEAEDVDDLTWKPVEKRLGARPSAWREGTIRRWLGPISSFSAVAAGILLVGTGLGVWATMPERPVSLTRGSAIQIARPAGLVNEVNVFEWSSPPVSDRFRVTVEGGEASWLLESSETRLVPPSQLLERLTPGHKWRWRVAALNDEGKAILESDWMVFGVR